MGADGGIQDQTAPLGREMDLSISNTSVSRRLLSCLEQMMLRLSRLAATGLSADFSGWTRWITALLTTAIMTVLEMILVGIMVQGALLPPVAAVVIATLVGGRRPGLLALALNLIIAEYIVIPPYYEFVLPWPKGIVSMTTFVFVATVAWYAAALFRDELAAVHERDELMATAAHDLRNPLHALALAIAQIRDVIDSDAQASPAELAAALSLADRQVVRMSRLIEGLLGATRTLATEREQVDLAELVREVVHEMSSELEASHCELQSKLTQAIGMWNRLGLRRVIANLLANAMLYAPGSPVRMDVNRLGHYARLEVADHGQGIDSSALSRILDRHQRAHSSGKSAGTGLGLYIVRQIVEAHGGRVTVHSTAGQGTRFVVMLPLGQAPSSSMLESPERSKCSASA
jgi:signal transduction histidine kinase